MTNRTASTNHETLSDAQYEAGRIDAPLPETLDRLVQIRKDNEIIAARCNLLGVDVRFYTRNFRKVGGLMTAEERALLDAAKAGMKLRRLNRIAFLDVCKDNALWISGQLSDADDVELFEQVAQAHRLAAGCLVRQITTHL